MEIVYENRSFTFKDGTWFDYEDKQVSEVLSNFLCKKAISEGADPVIFKKIATEKRSVKVSASKTKKDSNKINPEDDSLTARLRRGISFDEIEKDLGI